MSIHTIGPQRLAQQAARFTSLGGQLLGDTLQRLTPTSRERVTTLLSQGCSTALELSSDGRETRLCVVVLGPPPERQRVEVCELRALGGAVSQSVQ
jgi:hypothetical protein